MPPKKRVQEKPISGWQPERLLGAGASAQVWEAIRTSQGHVERAALKIFTPRFAALSSDLTASELARIEIQRTLSGHGHPHLVDIIDGGLCIESGRAYLVMNLLDAKPLDRLIETPKVPPERIGPLLAQVASAAEYLFVERSLVHRDIKPANVCVTPDFKKATLLDLGVLRHTTDAQDLSGTGPNRQFVGTKRYAAPESLNLEDDSEETGLAVTYYQLGAVLHDMIAGHRLFHDTPDNRLATLVQRITSEVPRINPWSPDIHEDFLQLCHDCLTKNWKERLKRVQGWHRFHQPRSIRRPTVVFLYAGGTIGSTLDLNDTRVRKLRQFESRYSPKLLEIGQRVVDEYRFLFTQGSELVPDIQWELLPTNEQLLSENATYQTWNSISASISKIADKYFESVSISPTPPRSTKRWAAKRSLQQYHAEDQAARELVDLAPITLAEYARDLADRYVAGIVVLHGTDTLAFSAPAVALALDNLPCPVVFTGSNRPPNEGDDRNPTTSRSDAWRNLVRSLHFIRSVGHRYPEVFVCFGDAIHHSINVRKTSVFDMALTGDAMARSLDEPFMYRNDGLNSHYMFKFIDGIFANNFYPVQGFGTRQTQLTHNLLIGSQYRDYKHARRDVTHSDARTQVERREYAGHVELVKTAPAMPRLDVVAMMRHGAQRGFELRAIIVEGYDSGTFPTHPRSAFSESLLALAEHAIPVVHVSRPGIIPAEAIYEQMVDVSVLRLYNIIPETALPLVSMITSNLSKEQWTPETQNSKALLQHRIDILRRALRDFAEKKKNILSIVLGDVTDPRERHSSLQDWRHKEEASYRLSLERVLPDAPSAANRSERDQRHQSAGDSLPRIAARRYFEWDALENWRPFERAGYAPDLFSLSYDKGFLLAWRHLKTCLQAVSVEGRFFADMKVEEREAVADSANEALQVLANTLVGLGLVGGARLSFKVASESKMFSMSCDIDREWLLQPSERQSVQSLTLAELEFLRRAALGTPLDEDDSQHEKKMQELYRALLADSWSNRLAPTDWFLLGMHKAAACCVLHCLSLDHCSRDMWTDVARDIELYRRCIRMTIDRSTRKTLLFQLSYTERVVDGGKGLRPGWAETIAARQQAVYERGSHSSRSR